MDNLIGKFRVFICECKPPKPIVVLDTDSPPADCPNCNCKRKIVDNPHLIAEAIRRAYKSTQDKIQTSRQEIWRAKIVLASLELELQNLMEKIRASE